MDLVFDAAYICAHDRGDRDACAEEGISPHPPRRDVPHMPIAVSASALVLLAGGFWYWGKRMFMRKALG